MIQEFVFKMAKRMKPVEDCAGLMDRIGEVGMLPLLESGVPGFSADEYIDLGCCYTSPGYTDEIIHVYLARGLHRGKSHLDEGEFLNVEKMPFEDLFNMVMRNEIIDAKTVIAVSKAKLWLDSHK